MAKFMNAELIAIRDNLQCGHCHCTFQGSDSQAWKVKYEKRVVYCSELCRHASLKNKFSTPIPEHGPCPTCQKMFYSRAPKKFCSMDCYVKSEQFITMTRENMRKGHALNAARNRNVPKEQRVRMGMKQRTGMIVKCLECESEIYQKHSRPRRFCSTRCYRGYMAKRFDRYIANPETIALPQGYDEFLDRTELHCLMPGCKWVGKWLSLHMNFSHGVTADQFKRAAGFNLKSGIVSRDLSEKMSERAKVGVANRGPTEVIAHALKCKSESSRVKTYHSLEAKEHLKKMHYSGLYSPGKSRICVGCGEAFLQSTVFGKADFCTLTCRDNYYTRQRHAQQRVRVIDGNNKVQWVPRQTPCDCDVCLGVKSPAAVDDSGWVDIVGMEGKYQINDQGLIRRLSKGTRQVSIIDVFNDPTTPPPIYPGIRLQKQWHRIANMVLSAFVGVEPALPYVRHLNNDTTDCRLVNLEWCAQEPPIVYLKPVTCKHGHVMTIDTVNRSSLLKGHRTCIVCQAAASKRSSLRKTQA